MTQLPERLQITAAKLIRQVDNAAPVTLRWARLPGGANNQVYRVECGESRYCLKYYFTHPGDPRDRLAHEYQFSSYAWSQRIHNISKPLATCPGEHVALYEYIDGRGFTASDLDERSIDQAIRFVLDLNRHRDHPEARAFPIASEACFHRQEHLDCVEGRLAKLHQLTKSSAIHSQAREFVRDRLMPCWTRLRSEVEDRLLNVEEAAEIGFERVRILSPSDFGFHNVLFRANGELCFLDFEYAGWDDPAKLVCDFFHQPEVPVPRIYLKTMLQNLAAIVPGEWNLEERVQALFPVYTMKWCCILLNDFLPAGSAPPV